MRASTLIYIIILTISITSLNVVAVNSPSYQQSDLKKFSKNAQFKHLKLSPNGKFIAATTPKTDSNSLVIIDREKMKPINAFGFGHKKHVGEFHWTSNNRIVYTKTYQVSYKEAKSFRGEIFSANIDGSKVVQIFGYSDNKSRLRSKRGLPASAYIEHLLPNDPDHILISSSKWQGDRDDPVRLYKVNIYNKKRTIITTTPHGNMDIVTDIYGIPVMASAKNRSGEILKYWFKKNKWEIIDKSKNISSFTPVSVSTDNQYLYLSKSTGSKKTSGLYRYSLKKQTIELLFNHEDFNIDSYIIVPSTGALIGATTVSDKVNYHYFDDSHAFTKMHKQLAATFPDHEIDIIANAITDENILVKITNDKTPGEYYLYNQVSQSVNYLIARKKWIYEKDMAPRKFIKFKARDGETIYGYLTLPKASASAHPLVVDVHGGPFGIKDNWHFNNDAQLYASQGYAVLQINFRGSGGYGKKYETVAYQLRDSLIQHDIIDGTRWALSLDNIDNEKVCIVGGSFGGYSAIMSPIIEPELYKCSISRYGPYDLVYQMTHADYMGVDSVSVGAKEKYGDNEDIWRKQSPLTYIEKFNTPVLIVTGGADKRVPPESAWRLKKALDSLNKPYQWLYKEKEGHGFTNPENKHELYQQSISFLNKHLK